MRHEQFSRKLEQLYREHLVLRAEFILVVREWLAEKAGFNPAQLREPNGQSTGGRWARDPNSIVQIADDQPPFRRLHSDKTYEQDRVARNSLDYWRKQPTDKIVESLKPGGPEPLIAK